MAALPPPALSVCIPTFNRAALLRRSLAELAGRIRADGLTAAVEVCVSDNASPDDTPRVLAEAAAAHPDVRWRFWRNPENVGGLVNIFYAADGATGDYLSITGDDDVVTPGGLTAVLDAARTGADLLLVNSHPGTGRWVRGLRPDDGTRRWFGRMTEVNARLGVFHASFLGNLVYRRAAYVRHRRDAHLLNAYPHTYVAAAIARERPALFVNRRLYEVDDSARAWRAWQPRYTCLDMARVQTDEVLPGAGWGAVAATYGLLVRSVPRAVLHGRADPRARVRPAEVADAYRASPAFQAVALGLWAAAAGLPAAALTRLLAAWTIDPRREGER